jgi:hypothetical protein
LTDENLFGFFDLPAPPIRNLLVEIKQSMFTIHGGSSQEVVLTPWMSNRRQPHFHLVIYCVADFLHFSNIQPFNNDNAPLKENVYKSMHVDPKFSMAIHLTDVYTSKKKEKNM